MAKRRAKRPLNRNAVAAADKVIRDRQGSGRKLDPNSPDDADLRKLWMDAYIAAGGEVEGASSDPDPVKSPVEPCTGQKGEEEQDHWIGIEARYDDRWSTSVSKVPTKATVAGTVVFDGPKTKCFSTLGMKDCEGGADPSHPLLGTHRHEGVSAGEAVVELVGDPSADAEIKQLESSIESKLKSLSDSINAHLKPEIDKWQAADSWPKKYEILIDARNKGLIKGATAWKDDQVDFLKAVGNFFDKAWDTAVETGEDVYEWYDDLSTLDKVLLPLTIHNEIVDAAGEVVEGVVKEINELWERRNEILALFKAFLDNGVNAIEKAIETLSTMPGEVGEFMKDLWKKGDDWVQGLIEVCRETDVFPKIFSSIAAMIIMIPPTFWVEAWSTAEGYIIPEILVAVILAIITALSAGAGAGAIAARMAGYVHKLKNLLGKLGKFGKTIRLILDGLKKFADDIAKLVKALNRKIAEKVDGAVDRMNKIRRKTKGDEKVELIHGSKDTSKFPNGKLDPNYDGAFYTAKDPKVAQDAINHHAKWGQAPNPGTLKTRIPKSEFDALVKSGDIKIRKYKGFNGDLDTEEIMFVTPKAKQTFNKYMVE